MSSNFLPDNIPCLLRPWQLMKTSVLWSSIGLLKGPTGTIQKSRETGAISRTAQAVVPHKDRRCHNPNQAPTWAWDGFCEHETSSGLLLRRVCPPLDAAVGQCVASEQLELTKVGRIRSCQGSSLPRNCQLGYYPAVALCQESLQNQIATFNASRKVYILSLNKVYSQLPPFLKPSITVPWQIQSRKNLTYLEGGLLSSWSDYYWLAPLRIPPLQDFSPV